MSGFNKFFCFVADVANKVHNLGSDPLRIMLTDVMPNPVNTVAPNIVEITAGNGYAAGGPTVPIASSQQANGIYKLVAAANVVITAAGGAIPQFRFGVLYNDASPNKSLIGWWDFDTEMNLADGNFLTVTFDASTGILQLT
jgi:hypothetical protein